MPHLFLMVSYSSIAIVIHAVDMFMTRRIIRHTVDNFSFYVALGQDGVVLLYVLIGLLFAWWAFFGMPPSDKNMFIAGLYVIVVLLGISSVLVIIGIEDIIWRNPQEFLDLTKLFELVMLGYHVLKYLLIVSYTISLAEIIHTPPQVYNSENELTEMYKTPQLYQLPEMKNAPEEPKQQIPTANSPQNVWYVPVQVYQN
jgi:hypothetical protein